MIKNSAILILVILIMFTSCSKESKDESVYPVVTEIIDGVKVVTNPEYPRNGKVTYQLEEELIIGADEEDENYMLNRPFSVKVTENGTICILDWGDTCIKTYDNQGKFLRNIGREGQGPGEYGKNPDFSIGYDGKIFILDSRNSRVSIIEADGTFSHSFRVSNGFPTMIKIDKNSYIYFEKTQMDLQKEMSKKSIHRYNSEGEETLNYGNFKVVQPVITRRAKGFSSSTSRVAATTIWTVDREGKLYAGYGDKYLISMYDPEGNLSFKFGREYTPIPNKYFGKPGQPEFVGVFNVITRRWLFDDAGNMWIEIPQKEDAEEIVYDIFSPEGIYLKQAYVKHRFYEMKHGKAYSIVENEDGFRVVKRFRLVYEDLQK